MSLRERLATADDTRQGINGPPGLAAAAYLELKKSMHQTILDRIDLERLKRLTPEQFKHELALLVQRIIEEERIVLNQHERHSLVLDIQHEMLGFGPLEPLLADPGVSDILVNTCAQVYVERAGRLELTDVTFNDNAHLMKIIEKIVSRVGRRVDESSPMVDARLPDGSRVNAIIPPLAIQLIINREWGLAKNENPNQGSFIMEELTDLVEEAVLQEFERIAERGGVLGAMETGYQRGKIQEESMLYEHQKHDGTLPIIGVNTFRNPKAGTEAPQTIELARSTDDEKQSQLTRLEDFHARNADAAPAALAALQQAAIDNANVFEKLMDAVRVCSLGQITTALFEVGGQYRRNM
jgi:hypothetical protein